MRMFTTSWWVVNQPIVVVIFTYTLSCFRLVILPLLEIKPLSLHIVALFVSYLWWGDTLWFMLILLYLLLSYSRAMFPCMFSLFLATSCMLSRGQYTNRSCHNFQFLDLNNIFKSKLSWKPIRSNLLCFLYLFKNMTFFQFKYLNNFLLKPD